MQEHSEPKVKLSIFNLVFIEQGEKIRPEKFCNVGYSDEKGEENQTCENEPISFSLVPLLFFLDNLAASIMPFVRSNIIKSWFC